MKTFEIYDLIPQQNYLLRFSGTYSNIFQQNVFTNLIVF